jgi:hypothetical protein
MLTVVFSTLSLQRCSAHSAYSSVQQAVLTVVFCTLFLQRCSALTYNDVQSRAVRNMFSWSPKQIPVGEWAGRGGGGLAERPDGG